jgi:DNA-binding HxlR family transcriptional regulator
LKLLANGQLTESFAADCTAMRDLLSRVGDKWSVLTVVLLGDEAVRFNDLKRALDGISQKVLTTTLKGLERDGLVQRSVHSTRPLQVEYRLTALGQSLFGPVKVLALWAQEHRADVYQAREQFDRSTQGR